jgi:hypothetical protein
MDTFRDKTIDISREKRDKRRGAKSRATEAQRAGKKGVKFPNEEASGPSHRHSESTDLHGGMEGEEAS